MHKSRNDPFKMYTLSCAVHCNYRTQKWEGLLELILSWVGCNYLWHSSLQKSKACMSLRDATTSHFLGLTLRPPTSSSSRSHTSKAAGGLFPESLLVLCIWKLGQNNRQTCSLRLWLDTSYCRYFSLSVQNNTLHCLFLNVPPFEFLFDDSDYFFTK